MSFSSSISLNLRYFFNSLLNLFNFFDFFRNEMHIFLLKETLIISFNAFSMFLKLWKEVIEITVLNDLSLNGKFSA